MGKLSKRRPHPYGADRFFERTALAALVRRAYDPPADAMGKARALLKQKVKLLGEDRLFEAAEAARQAAGSDQDLVKAINRVYRDIVQSRRTPRFHQDEEALANAQKAKKKAYNYFLEQLKSYKAELDKAKKMFSSLMEARRRDPGETSPVQNIADRALKGLDFQRQIPEYLAAYKNLSKEISRFKSIKVDKQEELDAAIKSINSLRKELERREDIVIPLLEEAQSA